MVIGIAGVSRAGKTTLCKQIKNYMTSERVEVVHMDDFVRSEEHIPRIRGLTDWEHPGSVDYNRLISEVEHAKQQNSILLVEGILIFWNDRLLSLFDHKIFIEIDQSTFYRRKKEDERYNEPDWFIDHIWHSYLQYGTKNSGTAVRISGRSPFNMRLIEEIIFGSNVYPSA